MLKGYHRILNGIGGAFLFQPPDIPRVELGIEEAENTLPQRKQVNIPPAVVKQRYVPERLVQDDRLEMTTKAGGKFDASQFPAEFYMGEAVY